MKPVNWQARREKRELAKQLRRRATPEESRLWLELRTNQMGGVHFRRQHVIAGFIVDFYCIAARLIIELDGCHHLVQLEADRERDAVLTGLGNTVLRFPNSAVRNNLPAVLKTIEAEVKRKLRPAVPLPRSGEGDRG